MQKKSIRSALAVSMAALASFTMASPALAAQGVAIQLDVSAAGEGVEASELEEAIGAFLEEKGYEVVDAAGDDDVTLEINIDLEGDGEGFDVTMDWDTDGDAEDTDQLEIEADGLGDALVGMLDAFVDAVPAEGGDEDGEDDAEDDGDEE